MVGILFLLKEDVLLICDGAGVVLGGALDVSSWLTSSPLACILDPVRFPLVPGTAIENRANNRGRCIHARPAGYFLRPGTSPVSNWATATATTAGDNRAE